MELERINNFIGNNKLSVVEAMERIDINAKGILFIVDEDNVLIGALTDGDIRRWILKSGELSASVTEAMNSTPFSLPFHNKKEAVKLMRERCITGIPLIDEKRHVVDICLLSDYGETKKKDDLLDVPVVIMTSLYPYTKILPKPLIPIADTPIIERIIDYYTEFGIKMFYMTVNYKKGMIKSYFDEITKDYTIKYVEEDKPLGTVGSIKLVNEKFNRPIFLTNCDALILADYADIYKCHIDNENDITMVSALKNIQIPYGVLHMGNKGIIKSMEEKPKLSFFINTGMYVINPEIIELIPDNTIFHMTYLIQKVIKNGGRVGTYPISEDSFLDMGEFDEMKRMEEKLRIVSSKG